MPQPQADNAMLQARQHVNDPLWVETITALQRIDVLKKLTDAQQRTENAMFYLAVLSCVCVIVESEVFWIQVLADHRTLASFSTAFLTLKITLSAASLLLALLLVHRFHLSCKIKVANSQLAEDTKFYHLSSGMLWQFLLELLVCSFHIPVMWTSIEAQTVRFQHYEVAFHLDELDVFVFTRIYLLGRFVRNLYGFRSASNHIHFIGSFHHIDVMSIWFTIKYSFQEYPFISTAVAIGIDWVLTSAATNFLERGVNTKLNNIDDAIWLAIVTMTGVGYGEIAPQTLGGKVTIVIGAIIGGTTFTCLLRVVLIDMLLITPREKVVLEVVDFHRYVHRSRQRAAYLIQQAWKWSRATKTRERKSRQHKLFAAAEASRLLRFSRPIVSTNALTARSMLGAAGAPGALDARSSVDQQNGRLQIQLIRQHIHQRRRNFFNRLDATTQLLRNINAGMANDAAT
ncbi:TPA: LOW QUALITY PROTEIN: hypothetical protein N0F65_011545 [Lagenidium giganteum]|uniref:ETS domain-containing protein n=1 Tax=Lagenidium giganteum TaxID=4803 RepID=A0AAV2Z844_9STRA|nr:TPA: LOW QUALITY PROTEIN: hypothetical protein N0F65_011545 [Lagenidium giganteum]